MEIYYIILESSKMEKAADYYDVLRVSPESNEKELKSAYRKLALKFHPDKNIENKFAAEEKFKEVCRAYKTLSNPEKRMMYDLFGNSEEIPVETEYAKSGEIDILFEFERLSEKNLFKKQKENKRKRSRSREKLWQSDFESAFYETLKQKKL